jgi:hypothetical protein
VPSEPPLSASQPACPMDGRDEEEHEQKMEKKKMDQQIEVQDPQTSKEYSCRGTGAVSDCFTLRRLEQFIFFGVDD